MTFDPYNNADVSSVAQEATSITVTTPPGVDGAVQVLVRDADGSDATATVR